MNYKNIWFRKPIFYCNVKIFYVLVIISKYFRFDKAIENRKELIYRVHLKKLLYADIVIFPFRFSLSDNVMIKFMIWALIEGPSNALKVRK